MQARLRSAGGDASFTNKLHRFDVISLREWDDVGLSIRTLAAVAFVVDGMSARRDQS
jgi:hypothetical protein